MRIKATHEFLGETRVVVSHVDEDAADKMSLWHLHTIAALSCTVYIYVVYNLRIML
jgi:hypothetical protein